jgi:hypothetical protein
MKLSVLIAAVALLVLAAAPAAQARPYDGSDGSGWENRSRESVSGSKPRRDRALRSYRTGSRERSASSGLGGRPGKWCGWWMRTQKGGGAHLNLAWNWSRWGSPTSAQVGAVVVWRHHVGIITGRSANGQWIVKSGNDGGRVRERARSVSGAVFRI